MKAKEVSVVISTISLIVSLILLVTWCAVTFHLNPLDLATYESIIVSVLGILVTLLIGWNIYTIIDVKQVRQDMLDSKNQMDEIRMAFDEQTKKQVALADAHAYMGIAEMFLQQGKFVLAYTKFISAVINYEKAGEHKLALHQCGRIYMLIRTVRRMLAKQQNSYTLDFDLYHDLPYEKDFSDLMTKELEQYHPTEMRNQFMHFITLATKHTELNGVEYTLYDRDANIKQRPIAIYLLLEKDHVLCKTTEFDKYMGLLTFDLNLNHDTVAIAEFSTLKKCKEAYAKIEVCEIVGKK